MTLVSSLFTSCFYCFSAIPIFDPTKMVLNPQSRLSFVHLVGDSEAALAIYFIITVIIMPGMLSRVR